MLYRTALLLIGLTTFPSIGSAPPWEVPAQRRGEVVTVVAAPKYYVIGAVDGSQMQFFTKADPKRMWRVDGLVLEVVKPPEHAGQVIGMHHDGVLASGNPYELWEIGRSYEFKVPKKNIGKISFDLCSLFPTRKVLPR